MSHTGRVTVLGYGSVVIFQANETLDSKKNKKNLRKCEGESVTSKKYLIHITSRCP